MRNAASDGAAVSHRAVGDSARGRGQPTVAGVRHGAVLDLGVGDGRAEENRFPVVAASPQIGAGTDVDEEVGLHQPQVQHRSERLSARDDLRVPFRRGEQLDRVGRVPGACVAEGGGLQDSAPVPGLMAVADTSRMAVRSDPAFPRTSPGCPRLRARAYGQTGTPQEAATASSASMIFASTFSMVTGVESTSTPTVPSASLIAFAMAAGGPMAPPSPMPFWPNRV